MELFWINRIIQCMENFIGIIFYVIQINIKRLLCGVLLHFIRMCTNTDSLFCININADKCISVVRT